MTPEEFMGYIQNTIDSIDDNKTFTGAEVKEIFSNIKDSIINNIDQLGYYLSAETLDGEEMVVGNTKFTKYNIKDALVLKVNELILEQDFLEDVQNILAFCKQIKVNGIIVPPNLSVLKLKVNNVFTEIYELSEAEKELIEFNKIMSEVKFDTSEYFPSLDD